MLREAYWQQFRDGIRRLEADSHAQVAERSDLDLYEGTLLDGLQDEETYPLSWLLDVNTR